MSRKSKIKGEQVFFSSKNRKDLARKIYENSKIQKENKKSFNIEEINVIELKESSSFDVELYNRLGCTNVPISFIAKKMNFRPERVRSMIKSGCIHIGTYKQNENGRDSYYCAANRVYSVLGIIYEPALTQSV